MIFQMKNLKSLMMKLKPRIKKLGWFRRWFFNNTHRITGLKAGPIMLRIRGEYAFIDAYGTIWRVVPSMDPVIPLYIQKVKE